MAAYDPGRICFVSRWQVSLTLAAVGMPNTESNTCPGYSLNEDALQLLRTVDPPKGEKEK